MTCIGVWERNDSILEDSLLFSDDDSKDGLTE